MDEKWYSLTIEETEKKLNTNVSFGLDVKEAECRRRRGEGGSVYKSVVQPPLYHISKVAADITVIIFVLTALISAFFDGGKSAVASVVLALVAFCASILSYMISRRGLDEAAELSLPRARVLRAGKIYVIDSRDVVIGDVLIFQKGDIVPCDCRLVFTDNLHAVEFIGKISGKEKKELTTKDASAIYRFEEKLGIAAQQNMISAAAVIASGSGRAVAVRTGKKTFVSMMLGELEPIPDSKREMKAMKSVSRLLSKCGLSLLIATVPITVIAMIVGKNRIGILDVLLIMLALALTSGSEIIAGFAYLFPAAAMKKSSKSMNGAYIKFPSALQEMNYLDSVMILGDKALCVNSKSVESIFASNKFYDASSAQKNPDRSTNCFLDIALLATAHYLRSGKSTSDLDDKDKSFCAKAISEFAAACGIDKKKLTAAYELVEFSPSEISGFDTSLVKNGDEYRVICASDSSSLLRLCTHIRTPEGAFSLDADKKSDIIRACSQLSKKSKSVTLLASRISPCSSLSRLGAVQNQLIFEGYIIYSAPYIENLTERVNEMQEADIAVYYVSGENAASVITAFNIGAVKGKNEIAYASAFRRSGKKISDDFGKYRAYLGFSARDIESLAKLIRGEDGTLAVIASDTEHLSIMNRANIAAAVSDCETENNTVWDLSHCAEIIRKNADVLLPEPKKEGGGFESFCRAVLYSKNACTGIGKFLRYISFTSALRLSLSVLPLLFGRSILSAVQIIFLGTLIDIPAMACFAGAEHTSSLGDRIEDIESFLSAPMKVCAKYLVSGIGLGAVILMLSAVFGSSNIATGSLLAVFAFAGAALSQLFAVFIIGRFFTYDKLGRRFIAVQAVIVILILTLSLVLPDFGAFLEIGYPGWQVCAAAPLVSVIGYVMLLVTDRYI